MQRAVYSPKEEGHYALASDCYCHFTSPIRRYPDLTVHRLLDEVLSGRKPRTHLGELVLLGQHCSDREQRAEAAERDLTKLKLLAYLSDRIGMEMDAAGDRRGEFRPVRRRASSLPAEGLIHADALADDYYTLRPRHAHADRPPPRQPLSPGRPAAGGRGPGRSGPPRAGLPLGRGGKATGRRWKKTCGKPPDRVRGFYRRNLEKPPDCVGGSYRRNLEKPPDCVRGSARGRPERRVIGKPRADTLRRAREPARKPDTRERKGPRPGDGSGDPASCRGPRPDLHAPWVTRKRGNAETRKRGQTLTISTARVLLLSRLGLLGDIGW